MVKTKTLILTGATGFLGSHILDALVARNYNVIAIKRSTSRTWRVDHLLEKVQWVNIDERPLEDAFMYSPVDAVIHTACNYGRDENDASAVVETNVLFSLQLLETAAKFKVDVFFSSDTFFNTGGQVQDYMKHYTLSKKHFVDWLRIFCDRIKIVNLRLQHIYGPKDDQRKFATWLFGRMLIDIDSIPLSLGEQQRDFIYVEDVVSAYLHLLEVSSKESFSQYDVGTGKLTTVKAFVETMRIELEIQLGYKIKPRLGFGEVSYRDGELDAPMVNPEELMSLGWQPRFNLSDGLKKTIKIALLSSEKNDP